MSCGLVLPTHRLLHMIGPAAFAGVLCAAGAHGQPAPDPPVSSPPISVATAPSAQASAALTLDFTIRTKNGKPILDLKPSDLVLTDNGVPVELKNLRLVAGTDGQDRLVTLVFDSLDVAPAEEARKMAEKIVAQFPHTGYTYAVMRIGGGPRSGQANSPADSPVQDAGFEEGPGLRLLENYTTRRDLLRNAIAEATSSDEAQRIAGTLTPAEEQLNAFARQGAGAADAAELDRAELLLSAMEESQRPSGNATDGSPLSDLLALVRSQRSIPGRKVVVYFSQGLPPGDSLDTAGSVIAEANRSEVSIVTVHVGADGGPASSIRRDPVDAGSLNTGEYGMPLSSLGGLAALADYTRSHGQELPNQAPDSEASATDMQRVLAALANDTEGATFTAAGSMKEPLRQLRSELTDYYEAAYTPNLTNYNGDFHPLVVRSRRRHVMVRARAGYFALPPEDRSGLNLYEVPLIAVLASPSLPTAVAYRSQVLHLGEYSGKATGELVVQVPIAQVHIRSDADTNLSSVRVAIMMQVRNAKGEVVERFSEDVVRRRSNSARPGDGPSSGAEAAWRQDAIVMERPFSASPGQYILDSAVLDEFGGEAGAQRVKFTIAPSQPQALLSDLVLVQRINPASRAGGETRQAGPMRYQDGWIIPNVIGVLPANTDHVSFFALAHLTGRTQPHLSLRLLRDGRQLAEIPITRAFPISASGDQAFPWLATVRTSTFPPGHYEVQAILSQGGETSTASTAFVVAGSGPAASVSFTAFSGQTDPHSDLPAEQRLTESAALGSTWFAISSPANPIAPPTHAEISAMVESARRRALAWTASLPNFFCTETTWHSVYSRSSELWKPKESTVQLLQYVDHAEHRRMLAFNGSQHDLPSNISFDHSIGEFGGALRGIFEPQAHTQFSWEKFELLDGEPVQVLSYQVQRPTSSFYVTDGSEGAMVAFHGLVWIDAATHNVRRITETIEDVPQDVNIRAASISIDYAWMTIDRHEYMLPVHGAVSLLRGWHTEELNQFSFTDYHRFGSQVRIVPAGPSGGQLVAQRRRVNNR